MCSIAGFDFSDKTLMAKMNRVLSHRGPDDHGIYIDDKVSLGHNRLSIIDISKAGHQPMSNVDETVWIVFNGEIYNYQEIKKLLEKKYRFSSTSDTEVIIYAYMEWGSRCVERFNGMWAFCIYDKKKELFFLSRDRIGKKPLYYYFDGNCFIFSSELKGILAHDNVPRKTNPEAVSLYLTMGFIPAPSTIFQNIRKLERSENLLYSLKEKSIKRETYYELPIPQQIYDKKNLIQEGEELLDDAVRLRKIADVDVGSFLSGGIDSSLVSTLLRKYTTTKLHTFSIGFENPLYDETPYAQLMAEHLQTEHHHDYFTEKDFERILARYARIYDEPFADMAAFPTIKVSELARKFVKVSLTGEGGDEIFGGYPLYRAAAKVAFVKKIPRNIRSSCSSLLNSIQTFPSIKKGIDLSLQPPERFYQGMFCQEHDDPTWFNQNFPPVLKKYQNLTESAMKFDLFYYTVPDKFNVKADRAGMANGLEIRCPLLDYRLFSYSAKIPTTYKVDIFHTKKLMKEIVQKVLPRKIITKKKKGFTPPVFEWMTTTYSNLVEEAMDNIAQYSVLSKDNMSQQLVQEYRSAFIKKRLNMYQRDKIYRLFILDNWTKEWLHHNE